MLFIAAKIMHFSNTLQLGKAPYVEPSAYGQPNIQDSVEACQQQCMTLAECLYGTYITDGPRVKECWLAQTTHGDPVECGMGCSSFKKVPQPMPVVNVLPLEEGTQGTQSPTPHATALPGFDHDDPNTNHVDLPHSHDDKCTCDPFMDPSKLTFCEQNHMSKHIIVHHLHGGSWLYTLEETHHAQHYCRMYGT